MPPSIKIGNLFPTFCFIWGRIFIVDETPSSCLPPWFEIHIASQNYTAIYASFGCIIPLRIIFSLVIYRIFLIVYQFILKSLFCNIDFLYLYCLWELELLNISSKTGKTRLEEFKLVFVSRFLIPRTWASTVMTNPVNPYFYANRITLYVRAQSFDIYICINLTPSLFASANYEYDFVDNVLKQYIRLFLYAMLAGIISPFGWTITFIAQGANPNGRLNFFPQIYFDKSVLAVLISILGIIINLWKLI